MLRDDVGNLGGIGAFDRHQHHADIAKYLGIFRQRQAVSGDGLLETLEAGQPQAVLVDFLDHARPRQ